MTSLELQGQAAKSAAQTLAVAGTQLKNQALSAIADALLAHTADILAANAADLSAAQANGMTVSMQDRLRLTEERIRGIADGVRQVAALPDPIGAAVSEAVRPNGLRISRRRVSSALSTRPGPM